MVLLQNLWDVKPQKGSREGRIAVPKMVLKCGITWTKLSKNLDCWVSSRSGPGSVSLNIPLKLQKQILYMGKVIMNQIGNQRRERYV